uniref:CUB domain-containing protein n=1 Tax=Pristionchus pacificus TaxID=54126 RepID=A0A8R1U2C0_PRIPA
MERQEKKKRQARKLRRDFTDHKRANLYPFQCIYTFVAGEGARVKLDFEQFQLAGTSENCEAEYVDIYSELERADENLLFARLGGRYCGSVSPHVRISLHNILVLVFHSRVGDASVPKLRFKGNYSFIPEARYIPGIAHPPGSKCSFIIDSSQRKRGTIYSPTYPGTYPKNFHCSYLLKGKQGQRIRLMFRDFDIYFGGEHCPYDSVTVYDGDSTSSPIIKKVCGLQQRMEQFSVGPELLIHFNATDPPKADPRGYVIEYEFSSRFVDVNTLLGGESTVFNYRERGVTHMRGTECNVRVESNRETTHYIHSPKYPDLYPANTTCTYILDGLQGDQNLEKVILTFEEFAVISELSSHVSIDSAMDDTDPDFITCPNAYVGIAINDGNMKATLSSTDESNFDHTLPTTRRSFGTTEKLSVDGKHPLGFKAKIDFKTDFGIPGEPVADSNVCNFRFRSKTGFFNSPRYPANYPLDTNCTYEIIGQEGQMILIHFEQFALEPDDKSCKDFLEIHDIFHDEGGAEDTRLQARYCSNAVPGPRFSAFGSHHMRVFFSSNSAGTGNGFKLLYEMRAALKEEIPGDDGMLIDPRHCGNTTTATDEMTPGYQILLTLLKLDVEGSMKDGVINCQKAVIRVQRENEEQVELCGQSKEMFKPMLSYNGSIRLSFITAPDKVNGLSGFMFSWTETRVAKDYSECASDSQYLCTYSKLCISAALRCNSNFDCGEDDDTDEGLHCQTKAGDSNWIITSAFVFSGCIFLFIIFVLFYLFKKKLEKKKRRRRRRNNRAVMSTSTRSRSRQPYRGAGHKPPVAGERETIAFDYAPQTAKPKLSKQSASQLGVKPTETNPGRRRDVALRAPRRDGHSPADEADEDDRRHHLLWLTLAGQDGSTVDALQLATDFGRSCADQDKVIKMIKVFFQDSYLNGSRAIGLVFFPNHSRNGWRKISAPLVPDRTVDGVARRLSKTKPGVCWILLCARVLHTRKSNLSVRYEPGF